MGQCASTTTHETEAAPSTSVYVPKPTVACADTTMAQNFDETWAPHDSQLKNSNDWKVGDAVDIFVPHRHEWLCGEVRGVTNCQVKVKVKLVGGNWWFEW